MKKNKKFKKFKKLRFRKAKKPVITIHHLTPRSRGGEESKSNKSLLKEDKHRAWHILFKNKTLEEIIILLTRFALMKKRSILNIKLEKAYCPSCKKETYFVLSNPQVSFSRFYSTHYATCLNCANQKTIFKERG